MGVYIKGMEMPESCKKCGVVSCGLYDADTWGIYRHPDCPLVEVPTPHGRLINADKLERDIDKYLNSDDCYHLWTQIQRTVIEAEDE